MICDLVLLFNTIFFLTQLNYFIPRLTPSSISLIRRSLLLLSTIAPIVPATITTPAIERNVPRASLSFSFLHSNKNSEKAGFVLLISSSSVFSNSFLLVN